MAILGELFLKVRGLLHAETMVTKSLLLTKGKLFSFPMLCAASQRQLLLSLEGTLQKTKHGHCPPLQPKDIRNNIGSDFFVVDSSFNISLLP